MTQSGIFKMSLFLFGKNNFRKKSCIGRCGQAKKKPTFGSEFYQTKPMLNNC